MLIDTTNKCSLGKTSSIGMASPSLVSLERKLASTFSHMLIKDGDVKLL
jgi:hypothetical protein